MTAELFRPTGHFNHSPSFRGAILLNKFYRAGVKVNVEDVSDVFLLDTEKSILLLKHVRTGGSGSVFPASEERAGVMCSAGLTCRVLNVNKTAN